MAATSSSSGGEGLRRAFASTHFGGTTVVVGAHARENGRVQMASRLIACGLADADLVGSL